MKQYSFLDESFYLEESWWKSALAGILSLGGILGANSINLPQKYIDANPGAKKTLTKEIFRKALESSKIDLSKFGDGFNIARKYAPQSQFEKIKKIGDNLSGIMTSEPSEKNLILRASELGKDLAKNQ